LPAPHRVSTTRCLAYSPSVSRLERALDHGWDDVTRAGEALLDQIERDTDADAEAADPLDEALLALTDTLTDSEEQAVARARQICPDAGHGAEVRPVSWRWKP